MIQARIRNQASDWFGKVGRVNEKDWMGSPTSSKFWIIFHFDENKEMLIARSSLEIL